MKYIFLILSTLLFSCGKQSRISKVNKSFEVTFYAIDHNKEKHILKVETFHVVGNSNTASDKNNVFILKGYDKGAPKSIEINSTVKGKIHGISFEYKFGKLKSPNGIKIPYDSLSTFYKSANGNKVDLYTKITPK